MKTPKISTRRLTFAMADNGCIVEFWSTSINSIQNRVSATSSTLTSALPCCQALAGLLKPDGGRMQAAGPRSFVFQNPDHQVSKQRLCVHMQTYDSYVPSASNHNYFPIMIGCCEG